MPVKKTNPFYKSYIDDFLVTNRSKRENRKRQAEWDDPEFKWWSAPKAMGFPKPTETKGKALINLLNREHMLELMEKREFVMPNFRQGDVIEIKVYHSLSEKTFVILKGICIGQEKFNSVNAQFTLATWKSNTFVKYKLKLHTPLLANLIILREGSNKLRKKLYYVWTQDWNKQKTLMPIVKGRGYKPRKVLSDQSVVDNMDSILNEIGEPETEDLLKGQNRIE